MLFYFFFFFKQKTAYDVRISDWSSAVCSSDLLLPAGVWAGPVHGYAELVEDPQVRHNGSFIEYDHPSEGWVKTPGFPIRFSRTPSTLDRGAPQVGEHSREILAEAGVAAYEIERLLAGGVVKQD